jgi:hypothetical protein
MTGSSLPCETKLSLWIIKLAPSLTAVALLLPAVLQNQPCMGNVLFHHMTRHDRTSQENVRKQAKKLLNVQFALQKSVRPI